tara:strand:+ start:4352 stop:4885 length:534 start_codon:yes stop_codon:yes gene_type:complete
VKNDLVASVALRCGNRSSSHSRTFERLVESSDDLVGLIAYAIYKQALREAAQRGDSVRPKIDRNPTDTERTAYRDAAQKMLERFGTSVINEAREDFMADSLAAIDQRVSDIASYVKAAASENEAKVVATVRHRTSFGMAIMVNIAGWFATLAITALIVFAVAAPGLREALRHVLLEH